MRQEGCPTVGGQGTGGARYGFIDRLSRPQEVKIDIPDPLHLAHETGMPVIHPDVAGHRAQAGILLQGRHQVPQGRFFDDAVGIHGDQDLTPSLGKPGIQPLFFAPVVREADGFDQTGIALPGPVDIFPGVVRGAVVDADNLQLLPGVVGAGHRIEGVFHHGALVISRNDNRQGRQVAVLEGKRPVTGPQDRPEPLEKEHQEGVAGHHAGEAGGIGPGLEQPPVGLPGTHVQRNHQTQHQGHRHTDLNSQIPAANRVSGLLGLVRRDF